MNRLLSMCKAEAIPNTALNLGWHYLSLRERRFVVLALLVRCLTVALPARKHQYWLSKQRNSTSTTYISQFIQNNP